MHPSGLVIVFADDATKEQKEQYERAVAHLKKSKAGKALVERLETSTTVFLIVFVDDDGDYFDPSTQTIYWDPYSGLVMSDGISIQSAALGLAHELGHAAQYLDGMFEAVFNAKTPEQEALIREIIESENMKNYETPIAKQLGEPTRGNYLDASGFHRMNNSTHFRAMSSYAIYMFWKWGQKYLKEFNES